MATKRPLPQADDATERDAQQARVDAGKDRSGTHASSGASAGPTPAAKPDDREGAGNVTPGEADRESARLRAEDPRGPESGQDRVEASGQMLPGDPADEKPLPPTNPPPQIPPGIAGSGAAGSGPAGA